MDFHLLLEVATALGTVFVFVVGLMIKAAQAKNREDLIERQTAVKDELIAQQTKVKDEINDRHLELIQGQNDLRADLDSKHAENKKDLAEHTAQDTEKFTGIGRTLTRIDTKLDQLTPRSRR